VKIDTVYANRANSSRRHYRNFVELHVTAETDVEKALVMALRAGRKRVYIYGTETIAVQFEMKDNNN
jgi:hypothetical protein